jgi:hypothetical protein
VLIFVVLGEPEVIGGILIFLFLNHGSGGLGGGSASATEVLLSRCANLGSSSRTLLRVSRGETLTALEI